MRRNFPWRRNELTHPKPDLDPPVDDVQSRTVVARSPGKRSASAPRDDRKERALRPLKSPSTSPPPEPLTETLMVEGLENDDRYRMVEDELLAVAGRFTAHLHAAEYQRQKQQAKTRNADTIDTISRPVLGRMTPVVKAKRERLEKTRKRKDGLRRAIANGKDNGVDVESDDDAPWLGTSLQGLMEAPRGSAIRLSSLASAGPGGLDRDGRGSARRAPGGEIRASTRPLHRRNVRESGKETTDDDDDDLDDPEPTRRQPTARPPRRLTTVQHAKANRPRSPKRDAAITPLLSDSDEDLFAGLRRRRQESRAPRGPLHRRNSRPAPSLLSTSARNRSKSPEASRDIIPSFL